MDTLLLNCYFCLSVPCIQFSVYRFICFVFIAMTTFGRMDEMMRGQRGWRELAILGDKINKFTGMIEGLIWSPRSGDGNLQEDDWAFEEVG